MVKFKVKHNKLSCLVELLPEEGSSRGELTLQDLKLKIRKLPPLEVSLRGKAFEVSLNGKDTLTGDNTPLKDLGLVSGDIIRIICTDDTAQNEDRTSDTNKESAQCSGSSVNKSSDGNTSSQVDSSRQEKPSTSNETAISDNIEDITTEDIVEDNDTVQDQQANIYMNEPMLVRESTASSIPQSLAITFQAARPSNQHEALFVLLHMLMLETGFQSSSQTYTMPDGWKKPGGVFKTQYTLPNAIDIVINLTMISLGKLANVFCTVSGSETKHQIQLNPAEYIVSISSEAVTTYKNLAKLSTAYKDKVSYPILQATQKDSYIPTLDNLVAEVQLMILKQLSARDLVNLSIVNRHFNVTCKERVLWRRHYMKDFGRRVTNNDISQDWYKLYKEKYQLRKEMRRNVRLMREDFFPPRPPPFHDPFSDPYPLHPGTGYPPGFVGGDYDRDPHFGGVPGMFGPGAGGRNPLAMPRPRFDPIGPHPGSRDPLRPPLPGWGPSRPRRDPGFGGGGFGFM